MNPLVSVMIGVYNGAPYLGEAIESVLAQDYAPLELIVCDDGSTDGSAEVAQAFDGVLVVRQKNAGNGAARNRAIEEATGELYAFLDADDRFVPGKLSLQKAALDADPQLDLVFGHVREFLSPELDEATRASLRPPAPEPMPWTAPNLMLIRRDSFHRVGRFATDVGSASRSTGSPAPRRQGSGTGSFPRWCSSGGCTRRTTACASASLGASTSR